MDSPIKTARLGMLPEAIRREIRAARKSRKWSQAELGRRVGLPQMHISGIESGKISPRFDTLLDLVRVLGFDLLLVPQTMVPVVQSLIRHDRDPQDSLYASNT